MKEKDISILRHTLHRHAESSGCEVNTAEILLEFLKRQNPCSISTGVGGNGILVVYSGPEQGRTVLLRCDTDAVPVNESTGCKYQSLNPGVSHKCGHDGHMAIMCAVAAELGHIPPLQGSVALLFQPAEETGEGAARVLAELNFSPDFCYALHNIPGFPMHSIITADGPFACASSGMIINLTGLSCHASQPHKGINPTHAVISIISTIEGISNPSAGILATIVSVRIGSAAFGTAPGDGSVMVTLRAPKTTTLNRLKDKLSLDTRKTAEEEKLRCSIEFTEEFPSTENSRIPNSVVRETASDLKLQQLVLERPFPWSEDFGHFTNRYSGALFGLGSGTETPPLHHPDYDFPDEIISTGASMFLGIIKKSLAL